ncbi:C39 family peptidase [Actinomadura barringtoniae]|uniref:C39 family peptidase n=1 Tax=Actinomadura barringtoniae TaxID=1427535 RepID=A0A939PCV0_9ACTN|nr:papain-like cysteine protease family protein [Actinomadura barringtoniae]MBO2446131.1 C39 family peptidase [Actinomadura barringtoniae]
MKYSVVVLAALAGPVAVGAVAAGQGAAQAGPVAWSGAPTRADLGAARKAVSRPEVGNTLRSFFLHGPQRRAMRAGEVRPRLYGELRAVYLLTPRFVTDPQAPVASFDHLAVEAGAADGQRAVVTIAKRPGGWQVVQISSGGAEAASLAQSRPGRVVFKEPQINAWYALGAGNVMPLNEEARRGVGPGSVTTDLYQRLVRARYGRMQPGSAYDRDRLAGGIPLGPERGSPTPPPGPGQQTDTEPWGQKEFPGAVSDTATTVPIQQRVQEQDQWCWDATGSTIAAFLGKDVSERAFCKLALGKKPGDDCPNEPQNSWRAMTAWHLLGLKNGVVFGRPLSFEDLKAEVDAHRPVYNRISWKGGGGHFFTIFGYDQSRNWAFWADPWGSAPRYNWASYDYLRDNNEFELSDGVSKIGAEWSAIPPVVGRQPLSDSELRAYVQADPKSQSAPAIAGQTTWKKKLCEKTWAESLPVCKA